jgi:hypothetical protein
VTGSVRKGGKASNALVAGSRAASGCQHPARKSRASSVASTGSEAESCKDDASVPEGDFEFSMDSGIVVCANRVHSLHGIASSGDAGEGASHGPLAGPGRHTPVSLSDDDSDSKVAIGDSEWKTAAPRQKKAPVSAGRKSLQCMYHFNCNHGARCEMTHSVQERAHFKLQGGPTPMWRTLKCDNTWDPDHEATGKDKCKFYHDIADAWCLVCKAKGHAACKNSDGGMHCRYQLK